MTESRVENKLEKKVEKKKRRRRARRLVRLSLFLLLIVVVLYLLALAGAIFGGGDLKSGLRQYEFIEVPAAFVEQNLNLTSPTTTDTSEEAVIIITVSEDIILFEGSEISLEDLGAMLTERGASYVELVDDSAKRVTYTKVFTELERLGVIIEEK